MAGVLGVKARNWRDLCGGKAGGTVPAWGGKLDKRQRIG